MTTSVSSFYFNRNVPINHASNDPKVGEEYFNVSVMDICKSSAENIAIVGEGGIGKTTFFHQLMREEFLDKNGMEKKYRSGSPIAFFIELNRCPEQIKDWYNETLGKTNFITRYIGQLYENHKSLDSIDDKTLDMIEKEFQRTPEDYIPRYLLLLDGFNEVKSSDGLSIRTMLSNEISVLNTYSNIRIITTSQETQAAYYAADFKNVQLIGLEDSDIKTYFEHSNISETLIGLYMSNKPLLKCLRIPLFLRIFTAEKAADLIPETPGEILYHFFHRDSYFYNIRKHAADTRTNPFDARRLAPFGHESGVSELLISLITPAVILSYHFHSAYSPISISHGHKRLSHTHSLIIYIAFVFCHLNYTLTDYFRHKAPHTPVMSNYCQALNR